MQPAKKLEITIYRISGKQFFFKVPAQWCEECDLTIAAVRNILKELGVATDQQVRLTIKPWLEYMDEALAKGAGMRPC